MSQLLLFYVDRKKRRVKLKDKEKNRVEGRQNPEKEENEKERKKKSERGSLPRARFELWTCRLRPKRSD